MKTSTEPNGLLIDCNRCGCAIGHICEPDIAKIAEEVWAAGVRAPSPLFDAISSLMSLGDDEPDADPDDLSPKAEDALRQLIELIVDAYEEQQTNGQIVTSNA